MLRTWKLKFLAGAALAAFAMSPADQAAAQSKEPIKIGFSMALTGPLSPNGKQALLGLQIWEEEVNAKGGLLGRPIKLVYYDDQSQAAPVPGIYTKLLDVDKVDLILGPVAPAPAFKIGDKINAPLAMYLFDLYTVSTNLAGIGGISIPCGFSSEGLPIGLHLQEAGLLPRRTSSIGSSRSRVCPGRPKLPG